MNAISPAINATVTASAGSGKTWLLVSRIVRLMLEGHAPGGILALTFTRKAAAEMQQRLAQRLYELATVDDAQLDKLLKEIDLPPTPAIRHSARQLYQQHQYCDYPLRAQTFHAFCQDILARFPLEADVPPGFALLDNETLLKNQAREALFNEAALNMQDELAQQLQDLMQRCGSYEQLKKALHTFIDQRSDWLAYIEDQDNPAGFAANSLLQKLAVDLNSKPFTEFFTALTIEQLETFMSLLAQHPIASNLKIVDALRGVLATPGDDASFSVVQNCFLTDKGEARKSIKDSKILRSKLGDQTDTLLQLNSEITANVLAAIDIHNRQQTWHLNQLWYCCGEHYLRHYQKLKRDMRLLDFADLEWKTFRLLRHADNAHWVQYKLDQRIEHLLIDEFQDTNPTQWQLLLPLLQEMAAGENERARSVFLVGDEKQSIYSFRRAKPELQAIASEWLADNLNAESFPLNKSWRSSPAIIDFVNSLFTQDTMHDLLPDFPHHEAHKTDLPGEVVLFPVQESEKEEAALTEPVSLRNPLSQPREEKVNHHDQEGQQIAQQIRQLIDNRIAVQENGRDRAINFSDIFILLRKRTHVTSYEKALREAGIPYIGANRGSLLDCIEVDDMLSLLDALLTPFNNLALAQVLKSPFFGADDDDLMRIAAHKSTPLWIDRLAEIAQELNDQHPLHRAHQLLGNWSALADHIPVHDLLDRIYHESQLLERYVASTPPALKPRVRANLIRFLEMALDLDSGRYPSLMHFLLHIRELQQQERDAPDEAPMQTGDARVKIMTIHASKGLEASVVFLADTINTDNNRDTLSALVEWPAQHERPTHMQLIPASNARDCISEHYLDIQKLAEEQELAHLLYVAVTRAKQCLYISGCRPSRNIGTDWYTPIENAMRSLTLATDAPLAWRYKELSPATPAGPAASATAQAVLPPFYFSNITFTGQIISPSTSSDMAGANGDADGQQRGTLIHRALDLLSRQPPWTPNQTLQALSTEMMLPAEDALLAQCLNEAQSVISESTFRNIFFPATNIRALNECSLSYQTDKGQVIGNIDRMLISDNEILIVDYKTHRVDEQAITALAEKYTSQMRHYARGAHLAWPGRIIKTVLVFTFCRKMVVVNT
ncbi:MAG: ATP-dependent helicase/nuclease subunit [Pseudomonadota bacterium]|nr:ATP-dependent helicase/nuclease subunit [Pseudomonadota bacterium]